MSGCGTATWAIGPASRIVTDPPDVLLTTPESLEAMLISRRVNERWLFPDLRTVIIDEVHAFAARRPRLAPAGRAGTSGPAGRPELQRIGLSATVGNPDELLTWLDEHLRSGPGGSCQPGR